MFAGQILRYDWFYKQHLCDDIFLSRGLLAQTHVTYGGINKI